MGVPDVNFFRKLNDQRKYQKPALWPQNPFLGIQFPLKIDGQPDPIEPHIFLCRSILRKN
jgi:hypothetical protein